MLYYFFKFLDRAKQFVSTVIKKKTNKTFFVMSINNSKRVALFRKCCGAYKLLI